MRKCTCLLRAHLSAKTPMPFPKLGLISTSSFNRSWSLPVTATFAFHIASVALATSAVTAARLDRAEGSRIVADPQTCKSHPGEA